MFYVRVRFEGLVQVLNFIQNMDESASGDYGCVQMSMLVQRRSPNKKVQVLYFDSFYMFNGCSGFSYCLQTDFYDVWFVSDVLVESL